MHCLGTERYALPTLNTETMTLRLEGVVFSMSFSSALLGQSFGRHF